MKRHRLQFRLVETNNKDLFLENQQCEWRNEGGMPNDLSMLSTTRGLRRGFGLIVELTSKHLSEGQYAC